MLYLKLHLEATSLVNATFITSQGVDREFIKLKIEVACNIEIFERINCFLEETI